MSGTFRYYVRSKHSKKITLHKDLKKHEHNTLARKLTLASGIADEIKMTLEFDAAEIEFWQSLCKLADRLTARGFFD